jgi:hypothetical protein
MIMPTALPGTRDHHDNQFRLVEIQSFNWGTFCGCFSFAVSPTGHLFVGPSGSGKSTILDGHSSLLTPPKWLDYNVAAREMDRAGRDRNPMTYVRGAWAEQTGESGEGVCRYLRTESTWSAIVETYLTARGRTVVLAQVLWVKGRSTAPADVRHWSVTCTSRSWSSSPGTNSTSAASSWIFPTRACSTSSLPTRSGSGGCCASTVNGRCGCCTRHKARRT